MLQKATFFAAVLMLPGTNHAQLPVLGDVWAHDPSTMIKEGSRYQIFTTGPGIPNEYSTDLRNW